MPHATLHRNKRRIAPSRRRGFSMMETAAAMGVFALGFVAIASIFPIAAMIQKQTTRQVQGADAANNVIAMMEGRKFSRTFLETGVPGSAFTGIPDDQNDSMDVQAILQNLPSPGILQNSPKIFEHWMLADRSFPSAGTALFGRDVYAVPLVRRAKLPTSATDWQVFVFILKRDSASYTRDPFNAFTDWANYDGYDGSVWHVPGVRAMTVNQITNDKRFVFSSSIANKWGNGFEIDKGDQVLDSNGNTHIVQTADDGWVEVVGEIPISMAWNGTQLDKREPNKLWYSRRSGPGRDSPTIQILVLDDAVE